MSFYCTIIQFKVSFVHKSAILLFICGLFIRKVLINLLMISILQINRSFVLLFLFYFSLYLYIWCSYYFIICYWFFIIIFYHNSLIFCVIIMSSKNFFLFFGFICPHFWCHLSSLVFGSVSWLLISSSHNFS